MKARRLGRAILFSVATGFSINTLAAGGMDNKPCNMPGGGMQGGGMHQPGGDGGPTQEMRKAMMGTKLASLKEALALSPDQDGAWQAFEEQVRTQIGAMEPGMATKSETGDPLQARITQMEGQLARMKGMAEAREQLMAALTPEQAVHMQSFPGGNCR